MSGAGGGPSGLRGRPAGRLTSRPSSAGSIARPRWRRRRTRGASARASGSAAGSESGSGGSRASSPRPRRRSAGESRSASGTEVSPSPASAPRGPPPALLTGLSPQTPATVAGAAPAPRRKALRRGAGMPRAASRRARGSRPKVLGAGSPPDKGGERLCPLAGSLTRSFPVLRCSHAVALELGGGRQRLQRIPPFPVGVSLPVSLLPGRRAEPPEPCSASGEREAGGPRTVWQG